MKYTDKQLDDRAKFKGNILESMFQSLGARCVQPVSSIDSIYDIGGLKAVFMPIQEGANRVQHVVLTNQSLDVVATELDRLIENTINMQLLIAELKNESGKSKRKPKLSVKERFVGWLRGPEEDYLDEEPAVLPQRPAAGLLEE